MASIPNGDDAEESQKLNDVWNYFEQEGTKVRCVVCRQLLVDTSYDNLKSHLFDQHPKLLLQLVQDQEQETKSNVSNDEDNTYTEVVYLEHDSASEDPPQTKETPKIISTYTKSSPKKRKRVSSTNEPPQKDREEKDEDESELDTFIKYIRCLLKKLSPDAFSKVQVEILKTIMDAQYSSKITDTKDTSISIPSTSTPAILTDVANFSVSKVIRVSEIPTENSSLVKNYTVLTSKDDEDTANT